MIRLRLTRRASATSHTVRVGASPPEVERPAFVIEGVLLKARRLDPNSLERAENYFQGTEYGEPVALLLDELDDYGRRQIWETSPLSMCESSPEDDITPVNFYTKNSVYAVLVLSAPDEITRS